MSNPNHARREVTITRVQPLEVTGERTQALAGVGRRSGVLRGLARKGRQCVDVATHLLARGALLLRGLGDMGVHGVDGVDRAISSDANGAFLGNRDAVTAMIPDDIADNRGERIALDENAGTG